MSSLTLTADTWTWLARLARGADGWRVGPFEPARSGESNHENAKVFLIGAALLVGGGLLWAPSSTPPAENQPPTGQEGGSMGNGSTMEGSMIGGSTMGISSHMGGASSRGTWLSGSGRAMVERTGPPGCAQRVGRHASRTAPGLAITPIDPIAP